MKRTKDETAFFSSAEQGDKANLKTVPFPRAGHKVGFGVILELGKRAHLHTNTYIE